MATSFRASYAPQRYRPAKRVDLFGFITGFLARRTQPRIERIVAQSGAVAWYARNPRNGKSRYAETYEELVDWLEATI